MYDNERDAPHTEEAEPDNGGLRSTVNRFWERLTRQSHADYIEDEEYDEAAAPAAATVGVGASTIGGGARVYGSTATTTSNASYQRTAPVAPPARSRDSFRVAPATGREQSISVMPVGSFGDVQKAADRLKSGEPQIINLEKTPPDVAERLIDFLNGVTYALDGYVEKISEGAYLFTPSHIAIHADGPEPAQPKPYFDRL